MRILTSLSSDSTIFDMSSIDVSQTSILKDDPRVSRCSDSFSHDSTHSTFVTASSPQSVSTHSAFVSALHSSPLKICQLAPRSSCPTQICLNSLCVRPHQFTQSAPTHSVFVHLPTARSLPQLTLHSSVAVHDAQHMLTSQTHQLILLSKRRRGFF